MKSNDIMTPGLRAPSERVSRGISISEDELTKVLPVLANAYTDQAHQVNRLGKMHVWPFSKYIYIDADNTEIELRNDRHK